MFQALNLANMFPLTRKSPYTFVFYSQLEKLFDLKMNSNMQILNNYRPVQDLNNRMVMSSFNVTATPTIAKGIALKISNAVLLLMLFGALFLR